MSALTEYNPLKSITVPGAEISDPEGLIVVIGPNSSGKTLFLKDIERYLTTGKPELIVCQSITPQKPVDSDALIRDLVHRRYLREHRQSVQHHVFQVYVPFTRAHTERREFSLAHLQKAYQEFATQANSGNEGFFGAIGQALVAFLSLDERREVCNRCQDFPYNNQAPGVPI